MPSFARTLRDHEISLARERTDALQVNLGLLCNQACKHCHLSAGPHRQELMDAGTAGQVADYVRRAGFALVDITGGAPELNPNLPALIRGVSGGDRKVMVRANLTALGLEQSRGLAELFADHGVAVVASLPALSPAQTEAQRGAGVFQGSLEALTRLNQLGYGREGSGLELNLVSNPAGAFLPPAQDKAERRFREQLAKKWGISFNHLYTFANVPLGRFKDWLVGSGNYDSYLDRLKGAFNDCAVEGLMCRRQVSVAWDGLLYDCDFNLAAGLPLGGRRVHVSQLDAPPRAGEPIAVGEHCFTCTAGAGFT
jgi:radical SAM/Cys-rich protein